VDQDARQRSRAAFDRQAPQYDSERYGQHARWLQPDVLAELARLRLASLLDVGCGTGAVLERVRLTDPRVELHGIDLSPAMLAVARQRLGQGVDLQVADAEALPLPDAAVDAVVCIDSFHHYPRPQVALAEMRRVLRAGGTLILAEWRVAPPLRQLMNSLIRYLPDGDVRIYSRDELFTLATAAGFGRLRWRTAGRRGQLLVGER
jgi:ubiquinone/menaquinone biosynthesis C-methylase UbiE